MIPRPALGNETRLPGILASMQHARPQQSFTLAAPWSWFLGLGIALIVLGIIALTDVFLVTLVSVAVVGWLLVIGGIIQIVHAFRYQGGSGVALHLLAGILYLVVGLMLVANPLAGAAGLALLAALFLFVLGLFRICAAAMFALPSRGWLLAVGILEILLAVLITAHWPSSALWVIGLFVGIEMLIGGGAALAIGLALRNPLSVVGFTGERHLPPAA